MSNCLEEPGERFCRALRTAGATGDGGGVRDELVARYREPHRRYHTLEHVEACLAWLDRLAASAERPAEVELALWFHDAVYDPSRSDNERRSAALARERLRGLGVAPDVIDRVASYVEATERHDGHAGDAALVIDIDLSILGAPPDVFARFEQQIREEYAHVPEPLFRAGRRAVLERFLSRPEIYRVPATRDALEAQARANLAHRIAEL